jgi:gliding motility-associated-like protein
MTFPKITGSALRIPAFLLLLLIVLQGSAQTASKFAVGVPVRFGVKPMPGNLYCWKVMENSDLKKGTETDMVTWLSGKYESEAKLIWKYTGSYYVSVMVSDPKGCANSKVYPVVVTETHVPVAVDDYFATNWLKNIRIDLLKNDHDAGNDIDTSSLKIISEPQYGRVTTSQKGVVTYLPQVCRIVRERFYYKICDLNNQCDSAMVSIDLTNPSFELPQMITPNGDGINDQFVITGLSAYPQSVLTIYSRSGEIVFQSEDYQNDWAGIQNRGTNAHCLVPAGIYYYLFHPGGIARIIKGFIYIAR